MARPVGVRVRSPRTTAAGTVGRTPRRAPGEDVEVVAAEDEGGVGASGQAPQHLRRDVGQPRSGPSG